uniref:BHLH domain-containing protein n=1 Tax=Heterorhabditis bacteriophora TaxID=37862 RepID=A0A1I7W6E7_HETBA
MAFSLVFSILYERPLVTDPRKGGRQMSGAALIVPSLPVIRWTNGSIGQDKAASPFSQEEKRRTRTHNIKTRLYVSEQLLG